MGKGRFSKFVSVVITSIIAMSGFPSKVLADVINAPTCHSVQSDLNYEITTNITSSWINHESIDLVLTNTGNETIHNWYLTFNTPYNIDNIWNGSLYETDGNGTYTITSNGWNQDIHTGESVTVGITFSSETEEDLSINPEWYLLNTHAVVVDASQYILEYTEYSAWEIGFTGQLTLTPQVDCQHWELSFDSNREITSVSSAVLISEGDNNCAITHDENNMRLVSGIAYNFGIQGVNTEDPLVLSNVELTVVDLAYHLTDDVDANGIPDYLELISGGVDSPIPTVIPIDSPEVSPDITENDEDEDGLPDSYEIIIIKHLLFDNITISGIDEILPSDDYDGDGLPLVTEYELDTNPFMTDSDSDGISDYDETYIYSTNPILNDTDCDGMGDGTEIDASLNPLSQDTDGNGALDSEEIVTQNVRLETVQEIEISNTLVKPSLIITGQGDYSERIYSLIVEDNTIFSSEAIVGQPFEFVHDSELTFVNGILSFYISDSALVTNNIVDLRIAYYNSDSNSFEILDTNYDKSAQTLSASISHLSVYAVINIKTLRFIFQSHSNTVANQVDSAYEFNGHSYALISNSMSWNDAQDYCSSLGGHLVIINNEEEQLFLNGLMQTYGDKNLYWIGLSGEDQQYSWVDGTPISYENWAAGEPNNSTETSVHMYCFAQGDFLCGQWNDTYNEYFVSTNVFWSTNNCGMICEWESTTELQPDGYWILLSNGTVVELEKNPALGDETIDSDDDGIPDVIELQTVVTDYFSGIEVWTFYSNPADTDTDSDGICDIDDLRPCDYDAVVIENNDSYIRFNSGRVWHYIPCNSFDYLDNLFVVVDGNAENPIPSNEFQTIISNNQTNNTQLFSIDELTLIGLLNNEGSKLYLANQTERKRETIFKRITGRGSRYYRHYGVLSWEDWEEVPKGTESGFFSGVVLSEANINFSTEIYYVCDVYTVLDSLIVIGAMIIAVILVVNATPVVLAHIEAIKYYVETYGVRQGLNMYSYFGLNSLPDGVITWIQMDLEDGDGCADDLIDAGVPIYQRGASGEAALQAAYPDGVPHRYFQTFVDGQSGGRYVDLLYDNVAYESKVGYMCLSQRIRIQILKDAWLLENGQVDRVVWVFYRSDITGRIGATQALIDFLVEHGIEYIYVE